MGTAHMKLSIGRAWDETKAVLARDGSLIVTVVLAFMLLPNLVVGLAMPAGTESGSGASLLVFLLSIALALAAQISISRIAMGPELTMRDALALGFRRMPSLLLSWVLWLLPFVVVAAVLLAASGIDPAALSNPQSEAQLPPGINIALMVVTVLLIVVAAHMQFLAPAAAATREGPVGLIRHSWRATRGRALKIFGLLLLIGLFFMILVVGVGSALGSVILLLLGKPTAWSLSAFLIAAVQGALSATVSAVSGVLLTRVYVQARDAGANASVPHAGGD